jgi:hypothetical protein
MKLKDLVIIISNKKGDCYQVSLSTTERHLMMTYLHSLHQGEINIIPGKLPMQIIKPEKKKGVRK